MQKLSNLLVQNNVLKRQSKSSKSNKIENNKYESNGSIISLRNRSKLSNSSFGDKMKVKLS